MRRGGVALLLLTLLSGACNSASKPKTDTALPTAPATPTTAASCSLEALGAAPTGAELSVVRDHRLELVALDGTNPRCLASDVAPAAQAPMAWGGTGDRMLLPPTSVFLGAQRLSAGVGPLATAILSRPNGTSVLAVGNDHHLRKHPIEGGPFTDISFLARTDEAIYHPAGRHIVAVGIDKNGGYGISIASNQGKDPRKLAEGENAKRIFSLAFSQDGETLWFLADHGDHSDVHGLDIRDGSLTTERQGPAGYERLVSSPFTRTFAVASRDCTSLDNGLGVGPTGQLGKRSIEPVGYLSDGRLVVMARAKGCTGPGDVHVLGPGATDPPAVVRNVESVAIRQALPPPGELPNAINPAPA